MNHACLYVVSLLLCINSIVAEESSPEQSRFSPFKRRFIKHVVFARAKDKSASIENEPTYKAPGANNDLTDQHGNSPLQIAVLHDNQRFVEFFINNGAAIEHKNYEGKTALMQAIEKQNVELVKLLIKYKADVNATDLNKMTPLMYAALHGNIILTELMLDYGANSQARDDQDATALIYGVQSGSMPVVKTLITYEIMEEQKRVSQQTQNLYHLAMIDQSYQVLLQAKDPEIINAKTSAHITPLMYAAAWGYDGIADYLIRHGADVSVVGEDAQTALHFAAQYGSALIVEMILANGGDINAKTKGGTTALMLAVHEGFEPIVASLIQHGANTNIRDEDGHTWTTYTANQEFRNAISDMITAYKYQKAHEKTEL